VIPHRSKAIERYWLNLDIYQGRLVRLNKRTFKEIAGQAKNQDLALENSFLVSGVSRGTRKLICYRGNLRIVVRPDDVVPM